MDELKSVQKSIRITPKVSGYVDSQKGKGWSEKLENLVLFCMEREPQLRETEKALSARIVELDSQISEKSTIVHNLTLIENYVISALEGVGKITL